jgi:hypothetical protein
VINDLSQRGFSMRTVALLATILALPGWLLADEPQSLETAAVTSQPDLTTPGKYDTSVYHLKHARARQIIPAVKQTIVKCLSAESVGKPPASSVMSVVFMPTTSDDTLVAVCSREHAAIVKQAIEACDVEKQYAVRVQLFEVSPNGEAAPVGEPAVFVGREGSVQCKTSDYGPVTLNLKVDDGSPVAADVPAESAKADASDFADCCGPSCCQFKGVCSRGLGKSPTAGRCCASCGKCESCDKCVASHKCEESCEKCGGSCSECEAFSAKDFRAFCQTILNAWARCEEEEHAEHIDGNASDEAAGEDGKHCPGRVSEITPGNTIAPASASETANEKAGPVLGCPACPPTSSETLPETPSTNRSTTSSDLPPVPTVTEESVHDRLFGQRPHSHDDGFLFEGVYRVIGQRQQNSDQHADQESVVIRVSDADDCDCHSTSANTGEHANSPSECGIGCPGSCPNASAEPPALLTLSARRDQAPNLGIVISPQWQSELAKIYQGRCLSEIFESRNGQDAGATALGRLLAEIPKSGCQNDCENSRRRNVIVVDLPDRIRVFESPAETEQAAAPQCPNCREQFHVFLEEIFRGSDALEEIAQAGHAPSDATAAELPRVMRSKLETTVVTYPLRDLVLLDDAERPVFDTCTIIDHIQGAVEPNSWWHPSVSIQLDQQSMSLVVRQTPDVHKKIEAHLHDLRRLQVKQLCNLIERLSADSDTSD